MEILEYQNRFMHWHLPINATTQGPVAINEEVDGSKQEHHCDRIIKESQHKDGVNAIRSAAHKEEHIRWNLKGEWGKTQLHHREANKREDVCVLKKEQLSNNVMQLNKWKTKKRKRKKRLVSAMGSSYKSTQMFIKCCRPISAVW